MFVRIINSDNVLHVFNLVSCLNVSLPHYCAIPNTSDNAMHQWRSQEFSLGGSSVGGLSYIKLISL